MFEMILSFMLLMTSVVLAVLLIVKLQESKGRQQEIRRLHEEMNRLYRLLKKHDRQHADIQAELEQSQANYESIFNTSTQGLLIVDPENLEIQHFNWRFILMCSLLDDQLIGKSVDSLFVEEKNQRPLAELVRIFMNGGTVHLDWLMYPKQADEPFWVFVSMTSVTYDNRNCVLISFVDISKRKHQELDIRANNVYLSALLRIHQLLHADRHLARLNIEVLEIITETADAQEIIYLEKKDRSVYRETMNYHRQFGANLPGPSETGREFRFRTHIHDELLNGREVLISGEDTAQFDLHRDSSAQIESLVLVPVFREHELSALMILSYQFLISRRYRYESDFLASCATAIAMFFEHQVMLKALNEREQQFRTLSDNQQAAIFVVQNRKVVFANARFFEFSGLELGAPVNILFHFIPAHARSVLASFIHEMANAERHSLRTDLEVRIPGKKYSWIDFFGSRIRYGDEDAWIFSIYDITEKKRVEKRLSLAQFSIDTAADSILWFNEEGKIIYANDQACRLLEYSFQELLEMHLSDIDPALRQEEWPDIWKDLAERPQRTFETVHLSRRGEKIPVEISVDVLINLEYAYGFIYSRDIRRRLEEERQKNELREQLLRSERLESLGFMAAGVAHEINNPMMGILNYVQILHDRCLDEDLKEYTEIISLEGRRISQIVAKLLDFANPHDELPMPVPLDSILEDSLLLVGANLRKSRIEIENRLQGRNYILKCRKGEIQQVILNLLQNARYSLDRKYPADSSEKKILITGRPYRSGEQRELHLKIRDNGLGIAEKNLPHIFTPYFTTKVRQEGTGLGLALSHNIVHEHGGRISVSSVEGEYAEFHLVLPML